MANFGQPPTRNEPPGLWVGTAEAVASEVSHAVQKRPGRIARLRPIPGRLCLPAHPLGRARSPPGRDPPTQPAVGRGQAPRRRWKARAGGRGAAAADPQAGR